MEKAKEFLKKYGKLCLEYNLEIAGSGEQGSPWLSKLNKKQVEDNTLTFSDEYEFIGFSNEVNDKSNFLERLKINEN